MDHQLDHSLTSMEWLYRLSVNKQILNPNSKLSTANGASKVPENFLLNTEIMKEQNINSNTSQILKPSQHAFAQRAEPNRPIDLSAEYKGNDHGRREGKPPYSYVNLITFAINSTSKKRMTLNEIYQWISDNFNYYKSAGNGWKVMKLINIK